MPTVKPLLEIRDLTVSYRVNRHSLDAVRDFSLQIDTGQTYGLVGESGSGKSTLALAVMGFLGKDGFIRKGEVRFGDSLLNEMSPRDLRRLWGNEIALVPQNPFTALNPSLRIGEQMAEALKMGSGLSRRQAREAVPALLEQVRLADPRRGGA